MKEKYTLYEKEILIGVFGYNKEQIE